MAQPKLPLNFFLFDIVRIAIALGYMVLGGYFIYTAPVTTIMPSEVAPYFGAALVLYGGFRLFRAIVSLRATKEVE